MANYTNNYNLEKPLQPEFYNVDVFNGNADKIDNAIKTEGQETAEKLFDFDNMAALSGTRKTVTFNADGSATEVIINTANSRTLATRTTTFSTVGAVDVAVEEETTYADDGATVNRRTRTTTTWVSNDIVTVDVVAL